MVKTIITVLVATTALASARPPSPDDYEEEYAAEDIASEPAFNMFGFRMAVGALPLDGGRATTLSLGLGVEHPVFRKTRVFGEYEWLWLSHDDERAMDSVVARPERHATGHRASIGLRRELIGTGRGARFFVDAELGGGLALANDNVMGLLVIPAGLAGVRLGYDLYSRSDSSPSSTFEAELLVRVIAIRDGAGVMMGIGMLWGN